MSDSLHSSSGMSSLNAQTAEMRFDIAATFLSKQLKSCLHGL
jgi:hypothetical protein